MPTQMNHQLLNMKECDTLLVLAPYLERILVKCLIIILIENDNHVYSTSEVIFGHLGL